MKNVITCQLCHHQDYIGNADLVPEKHLGFTVGRGKVMYFLMIWHSSGNVTVFPVDDKKHYPRFLTGLETIHIHLTLPHETH